MNFALSIDALSDDYLDSSEVTYQKMHKQHKDEPKKDRKKEKQSKHVDKRKYFEFAD